jgi:transglutaminase-like putative cysteine protease
MAEAARRYGAPAELAVAALVAAAGWPLTRLFRPGGAGGTVLVATALSLAVAWALRRLRVPMLIRLVLSAAAFVWFACASYAPHTLFAGFPTGRSLHQLGALMRAGQAIAMDQAAPVEAAPGVLMFLAAGVWATAWLVDASMALENPMLAIGCAVPMFLAPGSLVPSPALAQEAVLFLGAAAWVLFAHERIEARRRGTAARRAARTHPGWTVSAAGRVALAGAIVAVVLAPHLPGFSAPPWLRTNGPGARIGFDPIVAIKPTLDQAPNRVLLRVRTDTPGYFRLTELDQFDGKTWRARPGRLVDDGIPAAPTIGASTSYVLQDVTIDSLIGSWLPALYDPVTFDGPSGVRFEEDSHALLYNGLQAGLRYTVFSRVSNVTSRELDEANVVSERDMHDYLTLPKNTPSKVYDIARTIAGSQTTEFRKAVALQNYLRTFTYDQRVAAGNSFDTIVEFLTKTKRGYCEQFAASMAVLARALGIPSRVVIGFANGDRVGSTSVVKTKHAHAWVEIYFPGYDWVQFEPTPRAGIVSVPPYTLPQTADDPATVPIAKPTSSAKASPAPSTRPGEQNQTPSGAHGSSLPVWPLALLAIGLAGALGVPVFLRARSKRRAHRAPSARDAVAMRYGDFLAWCGLAGLPRRDGETPAEFSARLSTIAPPAAQALGNLSQMAAEALWAPPNGLVLAEFERAAADVRARIVPVLPRARRLAARIRWGR